MTSPPAVDTLLQGLLESLPEPQVGVSSSGIVLFVNNRFAELVGVSATQLLNCSVDPIWPSFYGVLADFRPEVGHLTRPSEPRLIPSELRDRYGAGISVMLDCSQSVQGDVLVVRVVSGFSDHEIDRRFHSQRLETLGFLAGSVAHDFNNVLTGILGHVSYLNSVLPQQGDHIESLVSIEEGAVRAAGITQQIVNFSRLQPEESSTQIDLSDVCSKVCGLVKGAIPSGITLSVTKPSQPVFLLATEAKLTQILINLIINARDACLSGGAIEVAVDGRCDEGDVTAIFGTEPPSESYCALVVSDNGSGMTDDVKERLFEPYFTTKRESGTGLGLATVQSIVRSLGGAIIVESSLGAGTTFRIVLPALVSSTQPGAENGARRSEPEMGNGEHILVIDDEAAVRNVLGLSLNHLGYAADTAASGLEGLSKYQAATGASCYDLVVLDLLMPGISGEEVFERIQRLNPQQKILIVSGFSSEGIVHRLLGNGAAGFIQKQFSIETLSERVKACFSKVVDE